jgi:hypothetical protein
MFMAQDNPRLMVLFVQLLSSSPAKTLSLLDTDIAAPVSQKEREEWALILSLLRYVQLLRSKDD